MTTKTLTGTYAAAYNLAAPITTLSITASGTLEAGVTAAASGTYTVVNEGLIEGLFGISLAGAGLITNGGTIGTGASTEAMYLRDGGAITNRAGASILGDQGIFARYGAVTLHNLGTIATTNGDGIDLGAGGLVVNGSRTCLGATISSSQVCIEDFAAGTVINYGVIASTHYAIGMEGAARLINGTSGDTTATIAGGVQCGGPSTLKNFGTIDANRFFGVELFGGGALTNGSLADESAEIGGQANFGAVITGGVATNFATIGGASSFIGVAIAKGGQVTNGAAGDYVALIEGSNAGFAVTSTGPATLRNFGTVRSLGTMAYGYTSAGAAFSGGGRVINGSTADAIALIEGPIGVYAKTDPVTVTNFATIAGSGGNAVELTAGGRINAEAGSVFAGTVAAGSAVFNAVSGVTNLTALTAAGIVEGAGMIALNGGASMFAAGASLTAAKILVNGGSAEVGGKLADTGDWAQSGATLVVDAGAAINFKGATNSFSGTLTGAGAITFSGGADTLTDTTLSAATMTVNGAVLTVSNVTLTGGGSLNLTNLTTNVIRGATAGAILTNAGDRIAGAGQLGGGRMALINGSGGVIVGNQTNALIINTATSPVINAGLIENVGVGGTTITGAAVNDGTLLAAAGTLAVNGAVSGAGTVKIAGGVAHFAAAFSQNVAFTGSSGVLELNQSQAYAGQVSGFSKIGTTSLDLVDIPFGAATSASFSGTTASGVLTVTFGPHTAKITLIGNYTASTFTVSSDGHGGTSVIDPAAATLVGAMAAFGARPAAAGASLAHRRWREPTMLARPA
jgi:hypothetical protein